MQLRRSRGFRDAGLRRAGGDRAVIYRLSHRSLPECLSPRTRPGANEVATMILSTASLFAPGAVGTADGVSTAADHHDVGLIDRTRDGPSACACRSPELERYCRPRPPLKAWMTSRRRRSEEVRQRARTAPSWPVPALAPQLGGPRFRRQESTRTTTRVLTNVCTAKVPLSCLCHSGKSLDLRVSDSCPIDVA